MKKAVKRLSVAALCVIMLIISVVPAFATTLGYIEDHNRVDCANYYVDGSKYKFLIKISDEYELRHIWVNLYDDNGFVEQVHLNEVDEKTYCSLNFEYNHNECSYYTLTIDTSDSSIPSGLVHKLGIKVFCSYNYMATNTTNGTIFEGPGYWLSR